MWLHSLPRPNSRVLTGTIERSYSYSLKGNKLPPMGVAMTIQGSLICPVTGILFMELPELPISNNALFSFTLIFFFIFIG